MNLKNPPRPKCLWRPGGGRGICGDGGRATALRETQRLTPEPWHLLKQTRHHTEMWSPRLIRRKSPFREPDEKSSLRVCVILLVPRVLSNIFQFTSKFVFRPYMCPGTDVIKINNTKKLHGVIFQNTVIIFEYSLFTEVIGGTRWRIWLRHCATSRKLAGSILNSVIGIFHWHNPSDHTMALGLTQPLTEKNSRNVSCGVKAVAA
jgi:hypothetical protein